MCNQIVDKDRGDKPTKIITNALGFKTVRSYEYPLNKGRYKNNLEIYIGNS